MAIPVVPTVRVVMTFTKFVELKPVEDFYTPLSSPRQFAANARSSEDESSTSASGDNSNYLSSWLRGGRHQKSSNSGGRQAVDPFAIPSGYSWSSFDEKLKKLNKSKSTRKTK